MSRLITAASAVTVLVCVVAAQAHGNVVQQSKSRTLTFQVYMHQATPAVPIENGSRVSSRVYAYGPALGYPARTQLGTITVTGQFDGTCTNSLLHVNHRTVLSCTGSFDVATLSKLPGGTLIADGVSNGTVLSLGHAGGPTPGQVVPIQSGTGVYKGATGSIQFPRRGVLLRYRIILA